MKIIIPSILAFSVVDYCDTSTMPRLDTDDFSHTSAEYDTETISTCTLEAKTINLTFTTPTPLVTTVSTATSTICVSETTVTTTSTEPIIEPTEIIEESETSEINELTTEPVIETEFYEEVTEPVETIPEMTYLGNLRITGYVATGNPTASGEMPHVGGVAMNKSYGLEFGTTIYIDGLGYYTVNDTGCSTGVVDVFCNSVDECYSLTSYADVYIVY